jgi:predicted RNase H-like nuclease (RuvC/YqgF family)
VLVGLYEETERPPQAVDYLKRYLGAPTGVDVAGLQTENQELKKEVENLKEMVQKLSSENDNLSRKMEEMGEF